MSFFVTYIFKLMLFFFNHLNILFFSILEPSLETYINDLHNLLIPLERERIFVYNKLKKLNVLPVLINSLRNYVKVFDQNLSVSIQSVSYANYFKNFYE